ncbi:zinc finger protein 462-like isoform X3 [Simochromis diagramma]|uniref:zinc finger protein 462-like isoform X3 n=1 Tax=Simochromis diagramma TaxID=43689 RepID=UPI001A7E94BB|nr:zinc finger protein 462-like isoform X3 [Simochromis diagramma]
MENDTVECSTSGHIKQVISQAVSEESQVEAFHCSHCVLIFESKVYLFEHLNKVHGLNTEISLREAGLSPGTDKANTESSSSGDNFKCQRCDFKACSWDGLSEHEELCHKTSENPNVSGGVIISENLDSTLSVISANQNNEAAGTSEDPSVLSDISTSEANCTLKDLKILQESPSSSCPNSSGVFKVTAKSVIDITGSKLYPFLHTDLTTDLTKTPEQFRKETVPDSAVKRSSGKSLKGHPVKKAKLDNEEMLTEKENENRQQSSSSEVSEDEDEADAAKVYSCKHCDYSDVGIRQISAHYQSDHPYIRYNSVYIQDASDHSATFRCLECPVEFLSTADLKRHYLENHPDAPDVFAMKSCGLSLVFKCFLCKFTTNLLKSLKEHYKAKHATYEVENSLLFCRYSMSECQEESSQLSLDVHYQKSHPDEVITLDKIKTSACPTSHAASEMTSEKCSDSVIVVDHSETTSEACKNRSESSQTTKGESSKFPTKSSNEITTGLDISSSSLPNETFYCQFCSYTSTKVKSILGHHYAKHSMDAPIGTDDVLGYSAEMQKRQSESKMSKSPSSSQFNTSKQVKMCREKEDLYKEDYTADASETGERQNKSYACPENLFYCHKCNFGNPSVKGVIIHQAKVHRKCNSSTKCVLEYTALIHDEIRKANAKDSSSSRLPPPIINEGEEKAFFCHFCNYRHSTLDQVMYHYSRTHGFKAKPSEVLLHTSKIHDQAQKSPLTSTQNEEAAQEILKMKMKKKKTKKHSKSLVISATPSVTTPHRKRSLNCYACAYKTDVIHALKTHLRKIHKVKRTVTDILRYYFRRGSLERGYYCEFCVFRHEKAAAVYEHYQERHLGRVPCVEYVSSRLYAGPGMVRCKKKKPVLEQCGGNGTENRLLSQRSGQNKAGLSCKRCSFKSNSLSDLAHHYRMVHPLSAKLSKETSASWRVEDQSDRSRSLSSKVFKCLYCSANFNSKHSLHTHCGLKHPEAVIERYEQEQKPEQQPQKRLHKTFKSSITAEKSLLIYNSTKVKCLKCPELTFKSSQLLIDHYSTFHRSEWKLDFTVLSLGLRKKKNTGVYNVTTATHN